MRCTSKVSILFAYAFISLPFNSYATSVLGDCIGHVLYAEGNVVVGDRAKIEGGSVRADDTIEVSIDAHLKGDILGGSAILRDRALVSGNVELSASIVQSNSAVVAGTIVQNSPLSSCTLEEKPTIAYGSKDTTILWDTKVTLPPGSYRDLTLYSRGAVKFMPGVYNFRKISAETDTKLFIQAGGDVEINVQENVFIQSRFQMVPEGDGSVPNVRLYSNQTTVLQIGDDSKVFGSITVPKSEVKILWRTAFQGEIRAAKVTLESDVVVSNSLDADGDGFPDLVEKLFGTDPNDANSRPATALPENWQNKPENDNSVAYDYSHFNGYASSHSVSVDFPAGTLTSDYIPAIHLMEANDSSLPEIPVPSGWRIMGKVFDVTGGITRGEKITFGFPLPDGTAPDVNPSTLTLLHFSGGQWIYIPVSYVKDNAIYAQVNSFSPFVVLQHTTDDPVIFVDMEYMEPDRFRDGKSWATAYMDLNDALEDALVSKKEIWVAGGLNRFGQAKQYFHFAQDSVESAFELFNGARIYGGFAGNETNRLATRSHKTRFKAYLTDGWGAIPGFSQDLQHIVRLMPRKPTNRIVKATDGAYLEGFHFKPAEFYDNHFIDFKSSLPGMGIYLDSGSMTISNCDFVALKSSQSGGAIYANKSNMTVIDSCRFGANQSDLSGGAVAAPSGNLHVNRSLFSENFAGLQGGAINAGSLFDSAYKSTLIIKNSVFEDDSAQFGGAVATKTMATFENTVFTKNTGTAEGGAVINFAGHLDVRNCTFYSSRSPSGRAYMGREWGPIVIYPPFMDSVTLPGDTPSSASFRNSILWNVSTVSGSEVSAQGSATIGVTASIIQNGYADAFTFDPLFYDESQSPGTDRAWFTEDDGLYLRRESPAIDAGVANHQGATVDILGKPRKTGSSVDLGAYEYNRIPPQVTITSPPRRSFTRDAQIQVEYSLDGQPGFSESFSLAEGPNTLIVSKARVDAIGRDSVVVIRDTQPPVLTLVRPSKDTVVSASPLIVEYRVDNGSELFSQSFPLSPKLNTITLFESDSAGNSASKLLRVYLASNAETGPSISITSPSMDTIVNRSPINVAYTLDGTPLVKQFNLVEGQNQLIVDTTLFLGFSGSDTINVILDTLPPHIAITSPAQDTVVQDASLTVHYTVDGITKSNTTALDSGFNVLTIRETDAAGNEGLAVRKVHYLPGGVSAIISDARVQDTIFSYQLFALDGRNSRGPSGVPLKYTWRQIQGESVHINTTTSRVAGAISRGPGSMRYELEVADEAAILPSGLDTVTIEVLEPENTFEYAQALEEAKSNQDGAFSLTIDPAGEASIYTRESSIRLGGTLTGTTGTLGAIHWSNNAQSGIFQPSGENWISSDIPLDFGDNWVTLIYTQGSQIAVDRILISRGEVDMSGFDLNPGVLWADSAMSFKLVVTVDDPAVSSVHLVRITNQELDLGALTDDGSGGDDFAMDRRHTILFNLTPHIDSVYWFRIKANKSGVNSYSGLYTFRPMVKYDPVFGQTLLSVKYQADSLYLAHKDAVGKAQALDSVIDWLSAQSSVETAEISADTNGIFWKYTNGVRAILAENTQGTLSIGSEIRTKGIFPYLWEGPGADSPLPISDVGDEIYRKMLDSLRQIDSSLWKVEPIIANDLSDQENVSVNDFKNWNGYNTILVETHGGLLGYGKLPAEKAQRVRWDKGRHIGLATSHRVTNDSLRKYHVDLTGDAPAMVISGLGRANFVVTEHFFDKYTIDTKGTLISVLACKSLANDNLWNVFRKHGDGSTAMASFSHDVYIPFARKSMSILYKNLIEGKTLSESYESVKNYCASDEAKVPGSTGGRICLIRNGKPCDTRACMEIRGNLEYTLKPRLGRVWHWGSGNSDLYTCAPTNADTVTSLKNIQKVSGGFGHGLALEANGTVWGWGWNGAGQLGIPPSRSSSGTDPDVNYQLCAPRQVFSGSNFKAISAGGSRSLAVDTLGQVWKAGEKFGTSGGTWTSSGSGKKWHEATVGATPQIEIVTGLSNISAVTAGGGQNLALDANGFVWSWGDNSSGELGLGDTLPRTTPDSIPGLPKIRSIAAGGYAPSWSNQSLALDQAGRVWAWGNNSFGQLGLGDTLNRSAPQLIPGLTRIKSISAGAGGCSAIDSSGGLWVWGQNDLGQLGLGDTVNRRSPVQIPGISNAVTVAHGIFPVVMDNSGNAKWSCGTACGNTFVDKKVGVFAPGSGGDGFGLSIAP